MALPSGETILLVDFYCYLQPLSNDLLLIWHEAAKRIVFTILDLPALQILEDGQEIAAEMKRRKETLRFKGGKYSADSNRVRDRGRGGRPRHCASAGFFAICSR